MAASKQLDPRIVEILRKRLDPNNGKVAAEAKYTSITPEPTAHSEEPNRGFPGGGAQSDPYGNALVDAAGAGIAGAVRGGVGAAADAASEGAFYKGFDGSVNPQQMARMSQQDILRALGNSRREAGKIAASSQENTLNELGTVAFNKRKEAQQAAGAAYDKANPGVNEIRWSGDPSPGQMSKAFYDNEERLAELQAGAARGRIANPEDATGVLKAPPSAQGAVPVTKTAPYAPGEAPHPDGLSPSGVVRAQMEKLNNFKPPQKLSEGGAVRAGVPKGTPHLPAWLETAIHARDAAKAPVTPNLHPMRRLASHDPELRYDWVMDPDAEGKYAPPVKGVSDPPWAKGETLAVDGLAHGGVVAPHHVYSAAADAAHKYCSGGMAHFADGGVVDEDPQAEQALIPQDELQLPGNAPQAVQAPVPVLHPAEQPVPDPKVAVGDAQLRQDDDPAARRLDLIEQMRNKRLHDSEPTTGNRAARALSAGLTAFSGHTPTDFDAQDRANRKDINDAADKERQTFLTTPADLAVRSSALPGSTQSTQLRGLVGKLLGDSSITANMSANELHAAGPFVQEFMQAQRAGDALAQQAAIARLRNAVDKAKLGVDKERVGLEGRKVKVSEDQLPINQQNADANMLRAQRSGSTHEDQTVQQYLTAKESTRSAPDLAQAKKDELALSKIDLLLQKPHPTSNDIDVLAGELAKVASGSAGNVHLEEKLAAPTLAGRYAKIRQYLTGQPGSAGYETVIKQVFAPYVKDLHKAVEAAKIKHYRDAFKNYESRLPPDFADAERAKLFGESQDAAAKEKDPNSDIGFEPE